MQKIAVVGVGHLGAFHAAKLQDIEACKLTGVYDLRPDRVDSLARKLGIRAYGSYESLLKDVDAVDIAATTSAHYDLAKTALEAGKHVFIEKPITAEVWQAEELIGIAKRHNLKLQVGHIERFNPVTLEVAPLIKDPLFIESHRLSRFQPRGTDVPVVLDLMIHDIDLILDFVQSPVKSIRATGIPVISSSIDIANARLEFENGAIANVTSSRVSLKQERKIRFFQRDAYFSLDYVGKRATVTRKSRDFLKVLPKLLVGEELDTDQLVDVQTFDATTAPKDALTLELESFIDILAGDKQPAVDGSAGLRALQIAVRIVDEINKQPSLEKLR